MSKRLSRLLRRMIDGWLPDHEMHRERMAPGSVLRDPRSAVPPLIALLQTPDARWRAAAARLLGWLGSVADAAVPALLEASSDRDSRVRFEAIWALGDMRGGGGEVMKALSGALGDGNAEVRRAAVRSLLHGNALIEGAFAGVAEKLQHPWRDVRYRAARVLYLARGPRKDYTPPESLVRGLWDSLRHAEVRVRAAAYEALASAGLEDVRAALTLMEALPGEEPESCLWMARGDLGLDPESLSLLRDALQHEHLIDGLLGVLGAQQARACGAAASIVQALRSNATRSRVRQAMKVLEAMGDEALPQLEACLELEASHVRLWAFRTWRDKAEPQRLTVRAAQLLQDRDGTVRREAAQALDALGLKARAAVPALLSALEDRSARVAGTAAAALCGMVLEASIPARGQTLELRERSVRTRWLAAELLVHLQPGQAVDAVPALVDSLAEGNPGIRHSATVALGKLGLQALEAIPALKEVGSGVDDRVAAGARKALERIDLAAKAAIVGTLKQWLLERLSEEAWEDFCTSRAGGKLQDDLDEEKREARRMQIERTMARRLEGRAAHDARLVILGGLEAEKDYARGRLKILDWAHPDQAPSVRRALWHPLGLPVRRVSFCGTCLRPFQPPYGWAYNRRAEELVQVLGLPPQQQRAAQRLQRLGPERVEPGSHRGADR